jgi:P4 family phage/plasmid primase-like protien
MRIAEQLDNVKNFVLWRCADKLPIDVMGNPIDATRPETRRYAHVLTPYMTTGRGLGLALDDGFFCIDLDDCLSTGGVLTPFAAEIVTAFHGAYMEISQSGRGVHIIGRGTLPPGHRTRVAGVPIEVYTRGRYVALTGTQETGDAWHDCQGVLEATYSRCFPTGVVTLPASGSLSPARRYSDESSDWRPVVVRMLASQGGVGTMFGATASAKELWEADVDVLSRLHPAAAPRDDGLPYDASAVDQALCNRLAFWLERDVNAMAEAFAASGPGQRRKCIDRPDYVRATCARAATDCRQPLSLWLESRKPRESDDTPSTPVPTAWQARTTIYRGTPDVTAQEYARLHPEMIHVDGEWLRWANGAYVAMEAAEMSQSVYMWLLGCVTEDRLGNLTPFHPKINDIREVLHALEGRRRISLVAPCWIESHPGQPDASDMISFRNGLLDVSTGVLHKPTMEFFTRNALDFDYDPRASCPRWMRFLHETWDTDEFPRGLQEMFGYVLLPDVSQQKIFMLQGVSGSGKSTILRVLRQLVGKRNHAETSANSLANDPFAFQHIVGKSLLTMSDLNLGSRADRASLRERLLSMVGQDEIEIRRKWLGTLVRPLDARIVIACNDIPDIPDDSGALLRRYFPITFERQCTHMDPKLGDVLTTELPGIMTWALEGLRRLRARGRFPTPGADQAVALRDIREESIDPWEATLNDLTSVQGDRVLCSDIWGVLGVDGRGGNGKRVRRIMRRLGYERCREGHDMTSVYKKRSIKRTA